jgi:hypothetical protein
MADVSRERGWQRGTSGHLVGVVTEEGRVEVDGAVGFFPREWGDQWQPLEQCSGEREPLGT